MNKVILIGRLTKDVELRTMPNGNNVASSSIATSERYKDQSGQMQEVTQFTNLVVFIGADNFAKYLHKGSQVAIYGKLKTSDYINKDGVKTYKTDVIVSEFKFLDKVENSINKEERTDNYKKEDTFDEEELSLDSIPF
jgi:single-strand DNA-binding protein